MSALVTLVGLSELTTLWSNLRRLFCTFKELTRHLKLLSKESQSLPNSGLELGISG